jgi:AraC-like DNA-binding protein
MDLLTDILQQAGLQRRRLDLRQLDDSGALRFPCDKSMGFHVVTQGQLYVHAPSLAQPLQLQAGDIALMARGCHHMLSTRAAPPEEEPPSADAPGHPPAAEDAPHGVISGAYQFWNPPLHPLFAELPAWFVLRAQRQPQFSPLALTVALIGAEAARPELGSETILNGLLDVAFAYLLREIVAQAGPAETGWGRALRGVQIRRAVEYLHADPARDWTLDGLAREVGLSRTALAQKFREALGDTPLSYLRGVRMQKAMRLLSDTAHTLEAVAAQVGYQDAFSFSKVFKRTVGLAPRDFRRQDAAARLAAARR